MEKFLYNPPKKNPKINMWFAFPAVESFALSSLGFLNIFKSLDLMENVFAERIYTDTIKTKIPIKDVDILGISTSFEIDILAIIKMLQKYNIPLSSKERGENDPLVFGGGPVLTANPLPYQEFYDFICVGDSKTSFDEITKILIDLKGQPKKEILQKLNELPYIWVPIFGIEKQVRGLVDTIEEPFATPILSEKSFFKNTYIIEIERGCPKQCSFCLASWLNLPTRFVETEKILKSIGVGLQYTDKIALLGAYVAGHPDFDKILDYLDEKNKIKPINLSISSLRADLTDEKVVKTLVNLGQKTCTIAIEAGSERLRKLINKDLKEEQILKTIKIMRENGLNGVKIYVMIGLLGETDEDIKALVELAQKIKNENKGFDVTYSLSTFIPKAQTPFQWAKRENTKSLEKKMAYLKKELHKKGINFRPTSISWDNIQAILSRYDKSLFDYFVEVVNSGGNLGSFKHVWKNMHKKGLLPEFNKTIELPISEDTNETLPWEFLMSTNKKILSDIFLKQK